MSPRSGAGALTKSVRRTDVLVHGLLLGQLGERTCLRVSGGALPVQRYLPQKNSALLALCLRSASNVFLARDGQCISYFSNVQHATEPTTA